jgi:malonate-semialdehyde dehydrogenase (acetylating)/methylmalonate-semialdehyde dehydrogenase
MAGSVAILIDGASRFIDPLCELAAQRIPGPQLGAIIDAAARARLVAALDKAVEQGARLLLDGRLAKPPAGYERGNWLGPSILDNATPTMECATKELFGPILTILRVKTLSEALELERNNPYGNATAIFTASASIAQQVATSATAGMIGVNIGVPVPREPFSFGGTKGSRFGHGDITGYGAVEFWTTTKKVTTKWQNQSDQNWMS